MPEQITVTRQKRATIYHDTDPESPREWGTLGTMACWHRRYKLGDEQPDMQPVTYLELLEANGREHLILPLFMYEHGGITMRTSPFSCPWDSGQVGIIHVSHEDIAKEYGEVTPETIERATRALVGEVEDYDIFLRGDVYGYRIVEELVDEDGEVMKTVDEIDSCWGFFHTFEHPATEAMKEHVPEDEKHLIDEAWERGVVYR